jgi:GDPmannose 4,6-dehydratase
MDVFFVVRGEGWVGYILLGMKKALITGVTGQDGSYLAELLLTKGYEVHGLIRRASSFNTHRLDPIYRDPHESNVRFFMHYGDLSDSGSLVNLVRNLEPDEVYHLGAQSHVKVSFEIPEYTADSTAMGTVRILEAIRSSGIATRFYQAGSSEMFGATPPPHSEDSAFHPRSPYAVAKVMAHWMAVNYREAYGMYACNGILFNHECVTAETPVVVRKNGFVDVVAIADLVPHRTDPSKGKRYTSDGGGLEVWDGDDWATCTARTATWHEEEVFAIHGRGGIVETTGDHVVYLESGERAAEDVEEGDRLRLANQPDHTFACTMTTDEAWLLGILVSEGFVSPEGSARIACGDEELLAEAGICWSRIAAGRSRKTEGPPSAFSAKRTPTLELTGNPGYLRMIRNEIYGRDGHKRIPKRILNASAEVQLAFLTAYNLGNGLWSAHGNGIFKSFRTSSPVLAAGLIWLARTTLGRRVGVYLEPKHSGIGRRNYLMDLSSGSLTGKGQRLRPQAEVRKVEARRYSGWMFDLATSSNRFAAGPGLVVVHNSPRRGETFVTRKITRAVARIKAGIQDKLYLGNLDSKRDWGYAPEYVEAMWLMLQQDEPEDFVIATGEAHSVREFCEVAFGHADLDWEAHVEIDPNYYRPAEVDHLRGNPSMAHEKLGWKTRTSFTELARLMVDADMQLLDDEKSGRLVRQDRDH